MKDFGIDISHWQGDFNILAAKAERQIKFVILKIGGADNGRYKDKKFEDFYKQCKDAGIPCGAYYFGHAFSDKEASSEAEHLLTLLTGKQFEYPIFYDVEAAMLSNTVEGLTNIVYTFCSAISSAGYFPGIYSSDSNFKHCVLDQKLTGFTHWVARYSSKEPVTKNDIWQFGGEENFLFSNIICGRKVDQDYSYRDFPTEIKAAGLNGFTKADLKSVDIIAKEVLAGKWGNGVDRKNALTVAGYNYADVQAKVSALIKTPKLLSTDAIAKKVIAGEYGKNPERKKKLEAEGYDYATVQKRVNELLKK